MYVDFLMIVLKKAIKVRLAAGKRVPRVTIMSATMDTTLFQEYFASKNAQGVLEPCPSLEVPGRMFPIRRFYLPDIMSSLQQDRSIEFEQLLAGHPLCEAYVRSESEFTATAPETVTNEGSETVTETVTETTKAEGSGISDRERRDLQVYVPTPLVAATIAHICNSTQMEGAILAFLPGMGEIMDVDEILRRRMSHLWFDDESKYKICILHSYLSKEQQNEIFEALPLGCRRIILSTNMAETSLTVPDVQYVVDSGRTREDRFEQVSRISGLATVWESKSSARQRAGRAGRAGRVRNGFYYALFSRERLESMSPSGLPALLRSDLKTTCLSIKAQGFVEKVGDFLAAAIEPPRADAVEAAVESLETLEAFTPEEGVTALGRVLTALPLDPSMATELGQDKGSAAAARAQMRYGRENLLNMRTFRAIVSNARQIEEALTTAGLAPQPSTDERQFSSQYGHPSLNQNSTDTALIKGLLVAGLYPNIAVKRLDKGGRYTSSSRQRPVVIRPMRQAKPSASEGEEDKDEGESEDHQGQDQGQGKIHAWKKARQGALVTYSNLRNSLDEKAVFAVEVTSVPPLLPLLFGGRIEMTGDNKLTKDNWLPFHVDESEDAHDLFEFRGALDAMLNDAFRSLSDRHTSGYLADDPARDIFARGVRELLSLTPAADAADVETTADTTAFRDPGMWPTLDELLDSEIDG
ncbi:Uu.00g113480.m01.CDS01 [Anthostomella pinea]|uniref:Uu.00g113480.m01.CDS01 n=1 Tax=Anthostomella pinea TaxID=933095 RepID=A0AAI8VGJ2_9PEZI|nr:Uu.00g113480.m01.CDS01 [Anthostomella pinea]